MRYVIVARKHGARVDNFTTHAFVRQSPDGIYNVGGEGPALVFDDKEQAQRKAHTAQFVLLDHDVFVKEVKS